MINKEIDQFELEKLVFMLWSFANAFDQENEDDATMYIEEYDNIREDDFESFVSNRFSVLNDNLLLVHAYLYKEEGDETKRLSLYIYENGRAEISYVNVIDDTDENDKDVPPKFESSNPRLAIHKFIEITIKWFELDIKNMSF